MILTIILVVYLFIAVVVFYIGSMLPGMGFGKLPWKMQIQIAAISIFWPIWMAFLILKRPPKYVLRNGPDGPIAESTNEN